MLEQSPYGPPARSLAEVVERGLRAATRTEDGCLISSRGKDKDGYPQARADRKNGRLHRFVYKRNHPDEDITGWVIRHTCDNPVCIEPSHLVKGSVQDNVDDRVQRGRNGRMPGERHPMSKLRNEDVIAIRKRLAAGVPQKSIAAEFGIHQSGVSDIKRGKLWSHIGGP